MVSPLALKISERQFMAHVMELAHLYKWKVYHTHDSRRSPAGYPDLTLVRPGSGNRPSRLAYAELKSAKGRLTREQEAWLTALGNVPGVETYCWRPSDWEEILRILK